MKRQIKVFINHSFSDKCKGPSLCGCVSGVAVKYIFLQLDIHGQTLCLKRRCIMVVALFYMDLFLHDGK